MTSLNGTTPLRTLTLFVCLSLLISGCNLPFTTCASARANKQLELAVKYLSEYKYKEAILAYQEVIKIDKKNSVAYKGLGLAYSLQDKLDKAEKALQDGLRQIPDSLELKLAIAGFYADQGKDEKAQLIYKEIISQDKEYLPAYQAYSRWLVSQGRQAEAIDLLEKAAKENPDQHQFISLLAGLYVAKGDNQKALTIISESISEYPDHASLYKALEQIYAGRWEELVATGDQYIKQNQSKTGQLLKLTGLYNMGNYLEVVKQYSALPVEIKDTARVKLLIARAYLKLGKKDRAKDIIDTIKVGNVKDAGMLADLAGYYLEAGDRETARSIAIQGTRADETLMDNYLIMFRSYEGEDKNLAYTWLFRYLLNSSLGYQQTADQLASSGLRLYTGTKTAADYVKEAGVHLDKGEYQDALENSSKAIEIDPTYSPAYVSRAKAYNFLDKFEKAVLDCNEAIKLEPNSPEPYDLRAWAYNELGQYNKAVEDCTKAIKLNSNYFSAYDHRAWAYSELGKYNKAIEDCTRGLKINPNYHWLYSNRGWSFLNLGQYEKAKADFQKALEIDPANDDAKEGLKVLDKMGH